ncbi:MAG: hypothetical protein K2K55_00145, partial [Duncaniella sp.]|nr:hypothetical protein [Duncaniella sp.]
MAKTIDKITGFFSLLASSAKSIGKMALLSRRPTISCRESIDRPLIIMGNGPSLAEVIKSEAILKNDTMAVNFAANAPEYTSLAPDFYLLADPHFEAGLSS